MAAFRETYAELHELRSLAPDVKMLALTATATTSTRQTITEILLMDNPHVIYENPSKANIAYSVHYMDKERSVEDYFRWLADELKEKKEKTSRTIIYCQTIKQCCIIYSVLKGILGRELYSNSANDPRHVLLEMLHSCTPDKNKDTILDAFQKEESPIRVLVATIAFGMGVDCKGVHRTIHFGPSKNIEAYIQETGRAGRDGEQSVAYLIYQGLFLNHVDKDIKQYVRETDCRRKTLLHKFDGMSSLTFPQPLHMCCDNCSVRCECGEVDCGDLTKFPGITDQQKECIPRTRQCTQQQIATLKEHLNDYHKFLVKELLDKSNNDQLKTLMNPQFLLGFSEHQILQVVANVFKMFTLDDVCCYVEIWNMNHAFKILDILSQVFGDICEIDENFFNDQSQYDVDCE